MKCRREERGFTLIELIAVVLILMIIAAIAIPQVQAALEDARVGRTKSELAGILHSIEAWRATNDGVVPTSLDVLVPRWYPTYPTDPWGFPYVYNSFDVVNFANRRKDGPVRPINKSFDLFSVGADGDWKPNIAADLSKDDVIVAQDGGFIGLPEDY